MKRLFIFVLLLVSCASGFAARSVVDQSGRAVTVPDHPQRIICLSPSVTDDVYALGDGANVIAVSDYTKYPAEARLKPSVGDLLHPSIEKILGFRPDLVIGSGDRYFRAEGIERIQKMGIPVFMLDPHGVAGIYQSIESLGDALNQRTQAGRLIADLRKRESAVRLKASSKPAVSIFMPVWYDPIITIGEHAFINEIIEIAGGRSVTGDIPQEWPQVSLEAIIARRPEGLLLVRGAKMSLSDLDHRPGWDALPALRNHRIYYVDDRINLPAPVAFDALEELASQFHPEMERSISHH